MNIKTPQNQITFDFSFWDIKFDIERWFPQVSFTV